MPKSNVGEFSVELPDTIRVSDEMLKPKTGRKPTHVARRNKKKLTTDTGKVTGNAGWYSDTEKLDAACKWAVSGNFRRVSELTGINESTLRAWGQTEWWQDVQDRIITEQDQELDTKLTQLVNKAVDSVNDRLEKGDYVYNPKLDKLIRKPINAKDLAVVTAITIDKRQLIRGEPTSRIEKLGVSEQLTALAAEFKKMALAKDITEESTVLIEHD